MPLQTFQGTTLGICTTVQPNDLNQAAIAALTYVNIAEVGDVGEWSTSANLLQYDALNTQVGQQQKGIISGGSPTVELVFNKTDAGQIALRAAAATKSNYAFKLTLPDGTIRYNRGVVSGPERPGGKNEDFMLERYQLGFNQTTIEV